MKFVWNVDVACHGMFDGEVNAFLVRVDTDLDRIVDTPGMRQGQSWSRVYARTS